MKSQFQPGHLLILILTGWINRRQQDAVEYREQLGGMIRYYHRKAA